MSLEPSDILKQYWGYDTFREPQDKIIASVLEGHDTFALLPTGGGKSICYQVPGMVMEGLTIVISPLIALMQDQVANLRKRGIPAAEINSSLGWREMGRRLDLAMKGEYKFLYCAPERLKTEVFISRLQQMKVALVAVDEAHCISQWGYDFRPAYLEIPQLRKYLPEIPFMALTASATPKVQEDIAQKLGMRSPRKFSKSFRRENLSYRVLETENVKGMILDLVNRLPGSGIVYARTRKRVEAMAAFLQSQGVQALPYHGGMEAGARADIQERWIQNETRVISATNAFGMGIDKPDVRWVIHLNLPSDLESYYQEAGRGGRDLKPAWAFAFRNEPDIRELELWVKEKYPTFETVNEVYEAMCEFFRIPDKGDFDQVFPLEYGVISEKTGLNLNQVFQSLRILHGEGLLGLNESPDNRAIIRFLVSPGEARRFMLSHPGLAAPVEFLLRSLGGGAFTEEAVVFPETFFRKFPHNEPGWQKSMQILADRGLLFWRPPTEFPSVRFFEAKRKLSRKDLNWDKYDFLTSLAQERLGELLRFVREENVCRSRIISAYFGEKDAAECGICDVCLRKAKAAFNSQTFEAIKSEMLHRLKAGPLPYAQLKQQGKSGLPEQRESVMRYLIGERVFELGEKGEVYLKEK